MIVEWLRDEEIAEANDFHNRAYGTARTLAQWRREFDRPIGSVLPFVVAKDAVQTFTKMLGHLQAVGGGLSLLFHPGQFHNPEYPETLGLYRRLLGIARDIGARSMHALAWIQCPRGP